MPRSESLGSYLDALASAAPTPGGGAAAAWTLAQAAALLAMVCRLTQGKPQASAHESALGAILEEAAAIKAAAEALADADSRAFEQYGKAASLPKRDPEEQTQRGEAMQKALADAARVPLAVYQLSALLLDDQGAIRVLAGIGNPRLFSDVQVAQWLALAALESSAVNVRVNLAMIKDKEIAGTFESRLNQGEAVKKWIEWPLAVGAVINMPIKAIGATSAINVIIGLVPESLLSL